MKFIIELVLQNNKYFYLKSKIIDLDWSNYGMVTQGFNQILRAIEKQEQD